MTKTGATTDLRKPVRPVHFSFRPSLLFAGVQEFCCYNGKLNRPLHATHPGVAAGFRAARADGSSSTGDAKEKDTFGEEVPDVVSAGAGMPRRRGVAVQLSIMKLFQNDLKQIEMLAAEISEGVIILDIAQRIVWANEAALAMHGVAGAADLGATIDDYHANFQVRFRSMARPEGAEPAGTERARDNLIEVTPLGGDDQRWLHRVRKLAVPDDTGALRYNVLVLTPLNCGAAAAGKTAALIECAPGAVAVLRRRDLAVVAANKAFASLAGLDAASGNAADIAERLIAGSEDPAHVRASIDEGVPFPTLLLHLTSQDGSRRRVLLAGHPAEFAGEACMFLTIVEWDGLRRAEAPARDLGAMHGFARELCAATPAPMVVLDRDGRVVASSTAWLDWLGYSAEAVTGRRIGDFMPEASAQHFGDHAWATLAAGGAVRDQAGTFTRRSGDQLAALLSAQATPDETGGLAYVVMSVVDVTERQRCEDRFSKLFALSPMPMVIRRTDDNRIMDANDAFMAMTGHEAEAVIGHCAEELWHFGTRAQRQTVEQELRGGKRVQKIDVKLKTAFGDPLDSQLFGEQVHVFGQSCAVLAFQDVTDRRRSEAELFEAIETVMEDTTWFTQSVIEKLAALRKPAQAGARVPEISDLTPREREVLGLISHGMTDSDIAEKLGLTRCTVRNHVATLYSKIGVHSRSSAIVWARERGVNLAWPLNGPANFMRAPMSHKKIAAAAKTRRP